jgi:ribosomal protein S18 acetylase RimI-like enzyme
MTDRTTGMKGTRATRTYLEMNDPSELRASRQSGTTLVVRRDTTHDPAVWRWFYTEVGRAYRWVDRLPWTDEQATAYLTDPAVSLWVAAVDGRTVGYFELRTELDGSVEIVYFGLLPEFTGRGLGGDLLTAAVEEAWRSGARRVWLHTCSFDHPAAIPNYLGRGFRIFKTEEYVAG